MLNEYTVPYFKVPTMTNTFRIAHEQAKQNAMLALQALTVGGGQEMVIK